MLTSLATWKDARSTARKEKLNALSSELLALRQYLEDLKTLTGRIRSRALAVEVEINAELKEKQ